MRHPLIAPVIRLGLIFNFPNIEWLLPFLNLESLLLCLDKAPDNSIHVFYLLPDEPIVNLLLGHGGAEHVVEPRGLLLHHQLGT